MNHKSKAKKKERDIKFKVKVLSRKNDPNLKMEMTFDVPIQFLPNFLGFLEKYKRNK